MFLNTLNLLIKILKFLINNKKEKFLLRLKIMLVYNFFNLKKFLLGFNMKIKLLNLKQGLKIILFLLKF